MSSACSVLKSIAHIPQYANLHLIPNGGSINEYMFYNNDYFKRVHKTYRLRQCLNTSLFDPIKELDYI